LRIALDTHCWLWWLIPDVRMSMRERQALDSLAAEKKLCVPAICIWEAQMLSSRGRIELPLPFAAWLRQATAAEMLTVLPLDADVAIALNDLPASFHGDPADRMIVATARANGLPLATHDKAIRKSRLVKIWTPPDSPSPDVKAASRKSVRRRRNTA
jgi:PIN domain nuclease of toxin-antitoxin system